MSADKPALKIGYVLRKFPVLSETFVLNEILALEARGIDVYIFTLMRPSIPRFHEDLPKLKATILYVPEIVDPGMLFKYNRRAAKRYGKRYLRTLGYVLTKGRGSLLWRFLQSCFVSERAGQLGLDHLHAHFATRATTVAFLASMTSGIPYSFTAHAFDIFRKEYSTKILARKIENADFLVTVSDFNKAYLERLAPQRSERIIRIYNGIDLSRFTTNGKSPGTPFTIVCVARLVEKKGHIDLIQACRILRDRTVPFRCWIVGTGHLRKELEKLIQESGLSELVFLLGSHTQMEVLERYRSAKLFVLPCRVDSEGNRDGLPVSLVEALACELPVVTTSVTGIPEVVRDGHNGLLVPEANPPALADAIQSLIRDANLYEHLRSNTRNSVSANFDIGQTAAALHKLFEKQELGET